MVDFAIRMAQTFAIDEAGNVYAWGYNEFGQIGIGTTTPDRQISPIKIYDVDTGRFLGLNGSTTSGTQVTRGTKMVAVFGDMRFNFIMAETGEIFASGADAGEQLGIGTTVSQVTYFQPITPIIPPDPQYPQ